MRRLIVGGCLVLALQSALTGQLLPMGATLQTLASGYRFTEGPLYDHAGGLYFSDLDMTHTVSRIYHYDIASHATTLVDGNSGGTNGTYYNNNGQIIASERDRRQMTLRSSSNVATVEQVLATKWQGNAFNGPNDVVVDESGGMYFTDPDYEGRNSMPEATYYLSSAGVLSQVVTGIARPNGVVLSPNGKTLYIAAWSARRIRAYDVTSPGVLTNGRDFVTNLPAGPDGITIDPSGNLYASVTTRVRAWNPAGTQLMEVTIPQNSTNVEIGGPAGKTLFITGITAVYGIDLNIVTIASSWTAANGGNWTGDNWTGGNPPNGVDHVATFGSAITSAKTVTVNVPRFVGSINFNSTNSYTIGGGSTVTLDVSSGQAGINVVSGNHVISAPLVLNDNLTLTVTPVASTLAITGNLQASGKAVTKSGNGTAQVENLRAASLNVVGGTLRISEKVTPNSAGGMSTLTGIIIAGGAKLDLTNNSLVIDYTGPIGSLLSDVAGHLASGRLISSESDSIHRLGYIDDGNVVKIKYTYAGDANLDGQVDIRDLRLFLQGFNETNQFWAGGDFDYDRDVDRADLSLLARNWQAGVGNPLSMDFSGEVPEPSASVGLMIAVISPLFSRRRITRISRWHQARE